MTDFKDPEIEILSKISELMEQGRFDEIDKLQQQLKWPAEALLYKKIQDGADAVRNSGLDLSEAEKAYGKDWLDRDVITKYESQHL